MAFRFGAGAVDISTGETTERVWPAQMSCLRSKLNERHLMSGLDFKPGF
jgi:hypothetical protein